MQTKPEPMFSTRSPRCAYFQLFDYSYGANGNSSPVDIKVLRGVDRFQSLASLTRLD